ncbi:hypothetical protein J1N35_035618 [Gossypium stocksii]|uniref:RNase H type-1 domain-containing protein n=1 Tax=Gossypium stocksii TaxID=47602 RepID=A0A9D3UUC9_9ROSI|nr:hypothetical protein J1N35_035618 [Gossypium stocksii]
MAATRHRTLSYITPSNSLHCVRTQDVKVVTPPVAGQLIVAMIAMHVKDIFSAASGVIRNSKREWILGYNCFLGKCLIATAELWGLLDGLLILQKQGYNDVIIRSDNLENVIFVSESTSGSSKNSPIRRIQQILAFEESWYLTYVPRETNRVVDALAKLALLSDQSLNIFEDPL